MKSTVITTAQPHTVKSNNYRFADKLVPYLLILPFIVSFMLFFLLPAGYSLILSFYKYRGFGPATFIGFENYTNLLTYNMFWTSVGNTLFYFAAHTVPVMIFSFLLAVAVHSLSVRWQRFYKPFIFLPQVMAIVAAALVWRMILSTRTGVINTLLGTQIGFLDNPAIMKWSVLLLLVWKSTGWFFVVFLTGLTTVNEDVRDAAFIDGANKLQNLLYITIPMIKPIFLFAFLMDTVSMLKMYTQPSILISGWTEAPPAALPIVSILVSNIKQGYFGMAAAVGWILFLMIFCFSMIQYKLFNERKERR